VCEVLVAVKTLWAAGALGSQVLVDPASNGFGAQEKRAPRDALGRSLESRDCPAQVADLVLDPRDGAR
jgi:hypothetical protein